VNINKPRSTEITPCDIDMPWPSWLSSRSPSTSDDDEREALPRIEPPYKPAGKWDKNLNSTDWSHYTSPQTITVSIITTATTLLLVRLYKTYLRRIPNVDYLKPGLFRRRSLYGYVTSVGDGDNFHLFHTPGGRWMGWGWFPGRQVTKTKKLRGRTVHVRLAGIDAPEMAHFGRPAQPHAQEALDWLRSTLLHRYVRAYPYRRDQYDRVVCTAYRRRWYFFRSDVGYGMLKRGLATVYEAKFGSEFGSKEAQYRAVEEWAKQKKLGMWQELGLVGRMMGRKPTSLESPREYKTRMTKGEKSGKTSDLAK